MQIPKSIPFETCALYGRSTKNYLIFGVLTLCSLFFLAGCDSDGKLRESLNEYVNMNHSQFFLTGKFVFDENVTDMNLGKITIDMLSSLRDEGLITYTVLESQGSIHEVDVKLTEEEINQLLYTFKDDFTNIENKR